MSEKIINDLKNGNVEIAIEKLLTLKKRKDEFYSEENIKYRNKNRRTTSNRRALRLSILVKHPKNTHFLSVDGYKGFVLKIWNSKLGEEIRFNYEVLALLGTDALIEIRDRLLKHDIEFKDKVIEELNRILQYREFNYKDLIDSSIPSDKALFFVFKDWRYTERITIKNKIYEVGVNMKEREKFEVPKEDVDK